MACNISGDAAECLCAKPAEPPAGRVYAPWVELDIRGLQIYCGNESLPSDPHTMAISSMQYGMSRGNGGITVEFEILSEGSEGYKKLFDLMNKTIKLAPEEIKNTRFRFGWILKDCTNNVDFETQLSPWIHILPVKMSTNIDKGIAKIKLECKDLLERHNDRRVTANIGSEGNLIHLKDAIIQLCDTQDPTIDVEFRNRKGDGDFDFEREPRGYKSVWQSNELTLLATIRSWVSTTKTADKKGVYFRYDPVDTKLVIQEDDVCRKPEVCACDGVIDSYVVNGGNCSPVIEFNPEIDWILDAGGFGGQSGSGSTSEQNKAQEPLELQPIEGSGSGNEQAIPVEYSHTIPQEQHGKMLNEATAANTLANKPFDTAKSIQGELVIIGDVKYANITDIGRYISISVLSPYKIDGGFMSPCTWIAKPPTNKTLSNKKWMLEGVDHQIDSGKFITKLKVGLAVPNAELAADEPIGGEGSCGPMTDGTGDGTFKGEEV